MPYSNRLIAHRVPATAAGGQLRKLMRLIRDKGGVDDAYLHRVLETLQEAHDLLYATVDYDDDGSLLGLAGEYEEMHHILATRAIPDYLVTWSIDIEAEDPVQAAQSVACRYFQEPIGIGEPDTACVFEVMDKATGKEVTVDLSRRARG